MRRKIVKNTILLLCSGSSVLCFKIQIMAIKTIIKINTFCIHKRTYIHMYVHTVLFAYEYNMRRRTYIHRDINMFRFLYKLKIFYQQQTIDSLFHFFFRQHIFEDFPSFFFFVFVRKTIYGSYIRHIPRWDWFGLVWLSELFFRFNFLYTVFVFVFFFDFGIFGY